MPDKKDIHAEIKLSDGTLFCKFVEGEKLVGGIMFNVNAAEGKEREFGIKHIGEIAVNTLVMGWLSDYEAKKNGYMKCMYCGQSGYCLAGDLPDGTVRADFKHPCPCTL